jgi:hypothetical protein
MVTGSLEIIRGVIKVGIGIISFKVETGITGVKVGTKTEIKTTEIKEATRIGIKMETRGAIRTEIKTGIKGGIRIGIRTETRTEIIIITKIKMPMGIKTVGIRIKIKEGGTKTKTKTETGIRIETKIETRIKIGMTKKIN